MPLTEVVEEEIWVALVVVVEDAEVVVDVEVEEEVWEEDETEMEEVLVTGAMMMVKTMASNDVVATVSVIVMIITIVKVAFVTAETVVVVEVEVALVVEMAVTVEIAIAIKIVIAVVKAEVCLKKPTAVYHAMTRKYRSLQLVIPRKTGIRNWTTMTARTIRSQAKAAAATTAITLLRMMIKMNVQTLSKEAIGMSEINHLTNLTIETIAIVPHSKITTQMNETIQIQKRP